jgi:predicted ATP-binding protein involved in virulence
MKTMQELHEEIFSYLINWSETTRLENSQINPYFYMRSIRDSRFKEGYWFPGNKNYLCISFWAGGDSLNKTPNIYFELNKKFGCRAFIVAKDSLSKTKYFNNLIPVLNQGLTNQYKLNRTYKYWIKTLSNDISSFQSALEYYINNDKRRIDEFIDKNKLTEYEDFVSRFGFITPLDFDTMISRVMKERENINLRENVKQIDRLLQPKLQFALTGISVENFQGFKNAKINDLPPASKWFFITGENGYGKTTFLQAIALGFCEDPDLDKFLETKTRISIDCNYLNKRGFLVRTKDGLSSDEKFTYGNFVLGYGPARLNVQTQSSENIETNQNGILSLFDNTTLLKNINYELFATSKTNMNSFNELQEIVKIVTKSKVSEILVIDREVLFIETLTNGDKLDPLPLFKLAAGLRSTINIVFDIYFRLKRVHRDANYKDFFGLVIIDEIENHLHPILQKELPRTLSNVFPNIQFIVSTHSPIPLLGAEKNSVILKVNRTKVDGITIERLDEVIDFPNLLPNTLLTSPIFGFQEIFSESRDDQKFIRTETTYEEIIENDKQKSRIKNYLTKDTTTEILNLLKKK